MKFNHEIPPFEMDPHSRLRDRRQAGRELALKLRHYANRTDVVVLALPRGGVPVAFEVEAVRRLGPSRVVVAVPVAGPSTCDEFRDLADEIVCARTPEPFSAVG